MIAGGNPFGNVAIAVSVTRPAISQWPVMVSLPADASRIAPQAPRGAAAAGTPAIAVRWPSPSASRFGQPQPADGARDVAQRVGARVAVFGGVRRPAASDAVGDQNHRAPKRAHAMSLHQRGIHYHGNIAVMAIARTRLTAQGQVSIPAEVRRRLGLTAGSVVEWDAEGPDFRSARRQVHVGRASIGRSFQTVRRAKFRSNKWTTRSATTCGRNMRAADTNVLVRLLVRDDPQPGRFRHSHSYRAERGSRTSSSRRRAGCCRGHFVWMRRRSVGSSRCFSVTRTWFSRIPKRFQQRWRPSAHARSSGSSTASSWRSRARPATCRSGPSIASWLGSTAPNACRRRYSPQVPGSGSSA